MNVVEKLIADTYRYAACVGAQIMETVLETARPAPAVNRAHAAADALADLEAETEAAEPRPIVKAFGISDLMNWMQREGRTDILVRCGHCLLIVGGPTLFAGHMLTCDLQPTSTPADPHPVAVDSRGGVDAIPDASPASALDWEGWAVPAILDVLGEAIEGGYNDHIDPGEWADWCEGIAPKIAARIACDPARAIAALQSFTNK